MGVGPSVPMNAGSSVPVSTGPSVLASAGSHAQFSSPHGSICWFPVPEAKPVGFSGSVELPKIVFNDDWGKLQ